VAPFGKCAINRPQEGDTMKTVEANFDGLVGLTHNYAGLSSGNVASMKNAGQVAHPREAAKQGLQKAKALSELGLTQGILAPHQRPDLQTLKRIGFSGTDKDIVAKAFKQAPEILAACYSCSPMWTANAATVSPSADTQDGKVHFTPANLNNKFHRSIEPNQTGQILKQTFRDTKYFQHHLHLPEGNHFGDEGAANHTRFCNDYGEKGIEFFVFGKYGFRGGMPEPKKFAARQTYEASMAVARLHGLDLDQCVFAQQNPATIDAGVFHNDVISVGNQNVYFYHQEALLNSDEVCKQLKNKFQGDFHLIKVPTNKVSVQDAVESYLFNSQLITLAPGKMAIVVPEECRNNKNVWKYLEELVTLGTPLQEVKVYDVKQSMQNGGGPACLRLRVVLNENELKGVNPKTLLTDELYTQLDAWIGKHYREEIKPEDLGDPALIDEVRTALDELTQIMDLGSIYPFQQ
jgi:succinylarginine dihydrolase